LKPRRSGFRNFAGVQLEKNMADITVRKSSGGSTPAPIAPREYDPFRAMREMFRWDPFKEMVPSWSELQSEFAPAFEVKENNESYLFKADVPGVKEGDLEVTVTGNRLSITGQRTEESEEKTETYYSRERKYGSFSRSYTLPEGADLEHVHADLKAGVLTVAVPKLPEVQPKKIAVKSATTKA
jgi:HSP20 family protein